MENIQSTKRYKNTFSQTDVSSLVALRKRYGNKTAADMVGMSQSGFAGCISKQKCSVMVSRLCEHLLKKNGDDVPSDKIWVVKVPHTKEQVLREVIQSLGGRIAFTNQ